MVVVTLQREKCIGCNYCVEMAPTHFQMSKKDGKTVLLHATDKRHCFIKCVT
jgi:ferredoxin